MMREGVRAKLRVTVKHILRKRDYPPDKQEKATQKVLEQAAGVLGGFGWLARESHLASACNRRRFAVSAPDRLFAGPELNTDDIEDLGEP